jgi:hypothetical protein
MKKNPLLIAKTNSNQHKIKRAKKMLFLSAFGLFAIALMFFASAFNVTDAVGFFKAIGCSTASLAFLPFVAGIKGTKAANGHDETDAEFAARAGKAEDDALFVKRLLASVKSSIDSEITNRENAITELKKQIPAAGADAAKVAQLEDELKKHGLALEALKETGKKPSGYKSINDQINEWAEANKTALMSIKSGTKAELKPLALKVASPMTPANTLNSSAYLPQVEYIAGVTEIVRVQPTFWDYIKKGRTGSATLVWVNKKNPLGAAAFIGPGVAKPGVSFELATETSVAKKVAVSEKCSTELLDDIQGMQSFIEQELHYQSRSKINTTLMTGASSSTVPAGIQSLSTTYSLTTVQTTNPNNWDAIIACVAQLRSGNLQGPVTAFVNPIDYANMILTKATSQGQLFVPAQTGTTIVEDNNVPVGYVQVALLDYYKVSIYKEMEISFGWENDDFTRNLVTVICESRIHQWFSENHTGAFIYDTFANIKTAITGS